MPPQHPSKAGTQAAPGVVVQPTHPHSAKRSLLSRQAPRDGFQQQQQQKQTQQQQQQKQKQQQQQQQVKQPAASLEGAFMDVQPPSHRLAAIPEATEESMMQDTADVRASVNQGTALHTAAPADAVSAPASIGFQEAAAARQPTSAEQVESLHVLASSKPKVHSQTPLRSGGEVTSKAERQHRGSTLSQPAAAAAAGREGVSAAAAPLSLLQLAAAPAAQHQPPSQGLALTHHQSAVQSAKHHHQPAAQPAVLSESSAAVDARQDASSNGADVLQGLQASLAQTVTSAVESAMMQMRWVFTQGLSTQEQKLLKTLLVL